MPLPYLLMNQKAANDQLRMTTIYGHNQFLGRPDYGVGNMQQDRFAIAVRVHPMNN
jgi:hypothetical protein